MCTFNLLIGLISSTTRGLISSTCTRPDFIHYSARFHPLLGLISSTTRLISFKLETYSLILSKFPKSGCLQQRTRFRLQQLFNTLHRYYQPWDQSQVGCLRNFVLEISYISNDFFYFVYYSKVATISRK